MKNNSIIIQGEVVDVNYSSDNNDHKNNIKVKVYPYDNNFSDVITAKPLYPNINVNPVKGEIVLLIKSLNSYSSYYRRFYNYYYFAIVNVHNNINNNILHNASSVENISNTKINKFQQSLIGNTNSRNKSTLLDEKFTPSPQQYVGDILYSGRWGNHIRFSRSNPQTNNPNKQITSWEKSTNNNDPILALVNGYSTNNKIISEDINEDDSSIYLASSQKLNLDLVNKKFDSFEESPVSIPEYSDSQILLNSGRVVINSKLDSIILSAKKYINLSADENHINSSTQTIISSPKIFIGEKDADEPLVLGNKNEDWLKDLLGTIKDLLNSLATHTHPTPVGPSGPPLPPELPKFSSEYINKINQYLNELPNIKSERNFTL